MTPCPSREQLQLLLAERLDEAQRETVTAHVRNCPLCQERVGQLTERSSGGSSPDCLPPPPPVPVHAHLPTALGAGHPFAPADSGSHFPAIAGYEIVGELGRGGMGVVYKARQTQLNRLVALKMILHGACAGPDELVRFLAEAEVIAALHHVGIVQIHDFGTHHGQPYFSMELCSGGSLAQRLAANPLPARSAASLVAVVARAVHTAHVAGIVHRDLKPANILFGDGDTPKVTDFGLAKRINTGPGLTQTGLLLGTPSYMAPEQARGSKEVGPAVDVWALGAILYECLTGRPPFKAATPLETLIQVQNDDPAPPARLVPQVPLDLETICLKCLEKDPRKRYAAALDLADDLGRFLDNQSITARRSGPFERSWRWYRRNLVVGSMAGCVLLLLLILGVGSSLAALWLSRERDEAERSREQAHEAERHKTELLWEAYQAQARLGHRSREPGQRRSALEAIRRAATIRPSFGLRNEAIACLAVPDLTRGPAWDGFPPQTVQLAFDGAMRRYARSDRQGSIIIRRVADDRELLRLDTRGCAAFGLEFSPDGAHLAANCGTGGGEPNQAFRVWEVENGREVIRTQGRLPGRSFAFSPNGQLLATGRSDGTLVVYRLPGGQEAHRLTWGPVRHLSFHPDGRRLALSAATRVQVVDVETGEVSRSFLHSFDVQATAWSPDGRFLASACSDWSIALWDAAEPGRPLHVLRGHLSLVNQVTFNHAGDLLASSGWDETVRLWSPFTGTLLLTTQEGHAEGGGDPKLRFSDDDHLLAFGRDAGSKAWLWQVTRGRVYRTVSRPAKSGILLGRDVGLNGVDVSLDGQLLAATHADAVRLWNAAGGGDGVRLPGSGGDRAVFHPDGMSLFTPGPQELYRWQLRATEDGKERVAGPAEPLGFAGANFLSVSRDGRRLGVVAERRGAVAVLDLTRADRRLLEGTHPRAKGVALSPDGRWAASATWHGANVRVWDVDQGQHLCDLPGGRAGATFSPDGRWLVVDQGDRWTFWEVGSWRMIHEVRRERGGTLPGALAFSRDGAMLAVLETPLCVRLLDVATGRALADLEGPERQWVRSLCFGPGGELVAAHGDLTMRIWDIGLIRQQLRGMGLDWEGPALAPAKRTSASPPPIRVQMDAREVRQFTGVRDGWVTRVAFTPDGPSALYIQSGRLMRLCLSSGRAHRLDGPWKAGGWALAVSSDGRCALSCGEPPDRQLYHLEVHTGRVIHTLRGHTGEPWAAAFSSDGTRAVSGGPDGIRHWDLTSGKEVRRADSRGDPVRCMAVAPDGRLIATGHYSRTAHGPGKVWIHDAKMGLEVRCLGEHGREVSALSFTPDGRRLLSAGFDGVVRVWDITGRREVSRFTGHAGVVEAVVACLDGKRAISAGEDAALRLWDITTGKERERWLGHIGCVTGVAVSPDGRHALSCGKDGTLRLWHLPPNVAPRP